MISVHMHRAIAIGAVLLALAAIALLYRFDPATNFFPACPFHRLTGLYCPGCGSQRAIHQLMHGHWLAAAGQNLLLLMMLPLLAWHALAWLRARKPGDSKDAPLPFTHRIKAWWILVLVLAFWLLRNLPFSPFQWLAPDL